jgi:thioredoxin 1
LIREKTMTATDIIGTEALQAAIASEKLTLVDFWAERCGPCRMLAPVLHALVEKYPDAVQLIKIDVDADENQPLAMQYAVSSIPQVTFFKAGKKVDQFVGVQSPDAIEMMIQKHITSMTAAALAAEANTEETPVDGFSVGD